MFVRHSSDQHVVKDIFARMPTLPSLPISEIAYRVLFTNASVNTCNNNLHVLTKP